ncbi:hypothetical protein EOPP23_00235 [Endozoicomonas sp. OPT23]|uniref:hypothetical protein n=1 Tax=Endozoicomonas sp. OPT23 TaxID=2072845 RepID=UPI00129BC447|nr:hypothetical protein [Endozoicomonas sp. OPT23]MRI31416.1 hypothetical protein [Endozoicomonas sp. OPT23]
MKYKVVFQGHLETDWTISQSRNALGEAFSLPSKTLDKIFTLCDSAGRQVTLKKNLSSEQADTYIQMLSNCGMKANKVSSGPPDLIAAEPVSTKPLEMQKESTQVCPKCRHKQPHSEFNDVCESCGIYMSKYQAQKEQSVDYRQEKEEPVVTGHSSVKTVITAFLALIICFMVYQRWPVADDEGVTGLPAVPVTVHKFPNAPYTFEEMLKPGYINVIFISDPTCEPCQNMAKRDKRLLNARTDVAITRIEIDRFDTHFRDVRARYDVNMRYVPFQAIFDRKGQLIAIDDGEDSAGWDYYLKELHNNIPR